MSNTRVWRLWVIMLALALLSACGFHLRTQAFLPTALHVMYLENHSVRYEAVQEIKEQLGSLGVHFVQNPHQAPWTLVLLKEQETGWQTNVAAGNTNQLQTYSLGYDIDYQLRSRDGKTSAVRSASASRNFVSNANQALSQGYEQQLLIQDMERDVAMQIANQLSSEYKALISTSQTP